MFISILIFLLNLLQTKQKNPNKKNSILFYSTTFSKLLIYYPIPRNTHTSPISFKSDETNRFQSESITHILLNALIPKILNSLSLLSTERLEGNRW